MRSLRATLLVCSCLAVLLPNIVSLRTVASQKDLSCNNPDGVADNDSSPAAVAQKYEKVIGTAQRGARYQFRPEQHYVLEGAQIVLDAGLTTYKFHLQPEYASGIVADMNKKPLSMLDIVKSADFPYQKVLDLPFKAFYMSIGSHDTRDLLEEEVDWYQQVYDLATYLIEKYKGSGKTFYLATDNADFQIRQHSADEAVTAATPIDASRQELIGKMLWEQQAAVEDARADADGMTGVQVYSVVGVNLMKTYAVDFTVIDDMVPSLDPVPDYLSVSLSSLPEYSTPEKIHGLLDHVASKLQGKDGVTGPRVLIEYGFPLRTADGAADPLTGTQQLQAQQGLAVAAEAIAWGSPAVAYATLYDHTTTSKNTAAARVLANTAAGRGKYQDRGVALVDKDGQDTVLFTAFKDFTKQATAWIESQVEASKVPPCRDHFRQWAVEALIKLASDVSPDSKPTTPDVIYRHGCEKKSRTEVL